MRAGRTSARAFEGSASRLFRNARPAALATGGHDYNPPHSGAAPEAAPVHPKGPGMVIVIVQIPIAPRARD